MEVNNADISKNTKSKYKKSNHDITQELEFVYELSACGFNCRCSHKDFRYCVSFEQGSP